MTERQLFIPAVETDITVHSMLRGELDNQLLIIVPGLGGKMNDLLPYSASRYFEERGLSTLRIDLYGNAVDQRNIKDTTVETIASDIDSAVNFAREQGVEWVGVIGHSYAGMAVLYSLSQAFDAAILWDPSHTDDFKTEASRRHLAEHYTYVEELDCYVSGDGSGHILPRSLFDNALPSSTEMAKKFTIGTLIVNASLNTELSQQGDEYREQIGVSVTQKTVTGASHRFTEDGALKSLFDITYDWLRTDSLSSQA